MNEQIIKNYFDLFFSAQPDFQAMRQLLADSFTFNGPLLKANSADDYIQKIQGVASGGLSMKNAEYVSSDYNVVVIYDMFSPLGDVRTVEWFKLESGKIKTLELLNDPRIFIEAFTDHGN